MTSEGGIRVLVVDDDALSRELYAFHLARRGFDVSEAEDGERALALLRTGPPDLVLLDIAMPVRDGWAVLDEMANDRGLARVPVVVVTGDAGETAEVRARDAGAAAYVAKPVDMDDLVRVIERALNVAT